VSRSPINRRVPSYRGNKLREVCWHLLNADLADRSFSNLFVQPKSADQQAILCIARPPHTRRAVPWHVFTCWQRLVWSADEPS